MQGKILTPILENCATKFYFGKTINPYTFHRLFVEFVSDEFKFNSSSPTTEYFVKLINKKEKKSIEFTKDYISFFPAFDVEKDTKEIEDIRKRIFRHVAQRHEVYSSTSKENLDLSMGSLLKNDLRTCASLLYYSLHKYTSSLLYMYFNTKLNIADHDIVFDEIEHYTSRMFLKFIDVYEGKGKISIEPNADIQDLLHHHTPKYRVDPFMLLRFTLENSKNYSRKLESYISFLSSYLFSVDYYKEGSAEKYSEIYQVLINELQNEKDQEKEVKATIAYCLKESITNTKNSEIWLLYTVALRLYWLRQTADYEFDFEVKTSVIEMAILAYTIGIIIEENESEKSEGIQKIDEITMDNKKMDSEELNEVSDKINTSINKKSISCPLYSIDFKFPEELLSEEDNKEVSLYMTVLHLDSQFDKNKILYVLNLMPNVTNRNKYFMYETSFSSISVLLYFTLDNDGRWIFWFTSEQLNTISYSESDLKESFIEFFEKLSRSYKDFHNEILITNIIGSEPRYLNKAISMINSPDILKLQTEIEKRRKRILDEIFNNFEKNLNSESEQVKISDNFNPTIKIFNLILDINFLFGFYELNLNIPLNDYYHREKNKHNFTLQVNIIISEKQNLLNMSDALDNTYNEFLSENKIDWFECSNIIVSANLFDEVLKEENLIIFNQLITVINRLCYNDIESRSNLLDTKNILEVLINSKTNNSLPFATLGFWYLNNGPLDDALEKGKSFYTKAIEIEKNNDNELSDQLEQKYYLELARFYCKKLTRPEEAIIYISEGIDKDTRFKKEFMELIDEFKLNDYIVQEDKTFQVASTEETQTSEDDSTNTEKED